MQFIYFPVFLSFGRIWTELYDIKWENEHWNREKKSYFSIIFLSFIVFIVFFSVFRLRFRVHCRTEKCWINIIALNGTQNDLKMFSSLASATKDLLQLTDSVHKRITLSYLLSHKFNHRKVTSNRLTRIHISIEHWHNKLSK